jgi:hypothetical protein
MSVCPQSGFVNSHQKQSNTTPRKICNKEQPACQTQALPETSSINRQLTTTTTGTCISLFLEEKRALLPTRLQRRIYISTKVPLKHNKKRRKSCSLALIEAWATRSAAQWLNLAHLALFLLSTSGCDRSSAYSPSKPHRWWLCSILCSRLRHFFDGHLGICSIAFRLLPRGVLSRKAARVVTSKDLI